MWERSSFFPLPLVLGLVAWIPPTQQALASQQVCPHDSDQRYIPAGSFIMGSTPEERELGYRLDKEVTRRYGWYDNEPHRKPTPGIFCMDRFPVTNRQYRTFVNVTGHREPHISPRSYKLQGFLVHPYAKVKPYLWTEGSYPKARDDHPVVLERFRN